MAIKSDGGSTPDLYGFPEDCRDVMDLGEFKEMRPLQFNCFKAAWRWGGKDGTDLEYDLKKIIFCAERALEQLEKRPWQGMDPDPNLGKWQGGNIK